MSSTKRILFIDHMRGFAVVIMVMGHTIDSVLSLQVRSTDWFRMYDFFRGFTAPLFLFVSGLAFSVAAVRRWDEYRKFSRILAQRLLKIALLFVIGYALHLPFFSLQKLLNESATVPYAQFFQVDILQCAAASLLVVHLLVPCFRSFSTFVRVLIAMGFVLIAITPVLWGIDFGAIISPIISPYFNQTQTSMFPLFPFAGYFFFGIAAGYYFLRAEMEGIGQAYFARLLTATAIISVAGVVFDWMGTEVYSPHDFWKTNPMMFAFRASVVVLISTAFLNTRWVPELVSRSLGSIGQYSLLVYTLHIILVYGSAANVGLTQIFGQTLSPQQSVATGMLVLASMVFLVKTWGYVQTHHAHHSRSVQAILTSLLLTMFLTLPY